MSGWGVLPERSRGRKQSKQTAYQCHVGQLRIDDGLTIGGHLLGIVEVLGCSFSLGNTNRHCEATPMSLDVSS